MESAKDTAFDTLPAALQERIWRKRLQPYLELLEEEATDRGLASTKDFMIWEDEKNVVPRFETFDRFDMKRRMTSEVDLETSLRQYQEECDLVRQRRREVQTELRKNKSTHGLQAYRVLYKDLWLLGRAPEWVSEPEKQLGSLLWMVGELWKYRNLQQEPCFFKLLVCSDIAQEHQELIAVKMPLESSLAEFKEEMRKLLLVRQVFENEVSDANHRPYLPDHEVFLDEWGFDSETGEHYPIDPDTGKEVDNHYVDSGKQFLIQERGFNTGVKSRSIMTVMPSNRGKGWLYTICPTGFQENNPLNKMWRALDFETEWRAMVQSLFKGFGNQVVIMHSTTIDRMKQQQRRAKRERCQKWCKFNPRRHEDLKKFDPGAFLGQGLPSELALADSLHDLALFNSEADASGTTLTGSLAQADSPESNTTHTVTPGSASKDDGTINGEGKQGASKENLMKKHNDQESEIHSNVNMFRFQSAYEELDWVGMDEDESTFRGT